MVLEATRTIRAGPYNVAVFTFCTVRPHVSDVTSAHVSYDLTAFLLVLISSFFLQEL